MIPIWLGIIIVAIIVEIITIDLVSIWFAAGGVVALITADTKGEVKVMSTSWLAASVDNNTINEGEYCEIMAIEGAHLVVKKIEE